MEFCQAELGLTRQEALHGRDYAEIVDMMHAWSERQSGKTHNWGGGRRVLDRVVELLSEWGTNGA